MQRSGPAPGQVPLNPLPQASALPAPQLPRGPALIVKQRRNPAHPKNRPQARLRLHIHPDKVHPPSPLPPQLLHRLRHRQTRRMPRRPKMHHRRTRRTHHLLRKGFRAYRNHH